VTFPAAMALLSKWAPPDERSKMTSFTFAGVMFGTVGSLSVSGVLCVHAGWESVFYVFGGIGLVWFVFWTILVYDSPSKHPWISDYEKDYIISQTDDGVTAAFSTPWRDMFLSVPYWAIIATHVGQNFGYYVLLTELPTYLANILHFDIKSNSLLSAAPYLGAWIVAIVAPFIADSFIRRENVSKTLVRKVGRRAVIGSHKK
jgi:ACS family sodium-dependent inorganic phosphate cotransporter-like MFS transporter 5